MWGWTSCRLATLQKATAIRRRPKQTDLVSGPRARHIESPRRDAKVFLECFRAIKCLHNPRKAPFDPLAWARMCEDVEFIIADGLHHARADLLRPQTFLDQIAHEMIGIADKWPA